MLYGEERVNSKVMRATHPAADLGLRLTQSDSQVFLLHALFIKDVLYAVYDLKGEVDLLSCLITHMGATSIDNVTRSHIS